MYCLGFVIISLQMISYWSGCVDSPESERLIYVWMKSSYPIKMTITITITTSQCIVPMRWQKNNTTVNDNVNHQPNETKRWPTSRLATPRMVAKERQRWIQAWASHSAMWAWIRYLRHTRLRSSYAVGTNEQKSKNPKGRKSKRWLAHVWVCLSHFSWSKYGQIRGKMPPVV